jgi:hypothetical protein
MRCLVTYDISGLGHCEESFVVDVNSLAEAKQRAFDAALERAEQSIVSDAVPLTKELAEEYGITWDDTRMPWREPADIPPEYGGPVSMKP